MKDIIRIASITQVHDFLGLPKPSHPLVSVIPIDEKIVNFNYGDATYIFDFFQINFKEGFKGNLLYGRNSYDFEEGSLTFLKPNQTLQIKEAPEDIKGATGWTLLFHPDLLSKSSLGVEIENYSFFNYDLNEALHISDKEKQSLNNLVSQIAEEYSQNLDQHSQDLIIAHIEMLLKYSKRFYDRQFYTRTNLNKDILGQFNAVLKSYYNSNEPLEKGVLTVKQCADAVNLSVNYLGDLLKSETGKSAKEHIQDYIINKAKSKLLGSKDGVGEIAYSLGYEYSQGFSKLFKAKVGMSPLEYRRLN